MMFVSVWVKKSLQNWGIDFVSSKAFTTIAAIKLPKMAGIKLTLPLTLRVHPRSKLNSGFTIDGGNALGDSSVE